MDKSFKILLLGAFLGYSSIITFITSTKFGLIQFSIGLLLICYAIWYLVNKE